MRESELDWTRDDTGIILFLGVAAVPVPQGSDSGTGGWESMMSHFHFVLQTLRESTVSMIIETEWRVSRGILYHFSHFSEC